MKKTIILINGYAGAGKDEFIGMCSAIMPGLIKTMWTSTPGKLALRELGWDGEKTPQARAAIHTLTEMGDALFYTTNNYLLKEVANTEEPVIFIHCREPYKLRHLQEMFGATTIFVDRPQARIDACKNQDNYADSVAIEMFDYDIYIHNDKGLENLMEQATNFCVEVLKND